jgi:hypothetical protein
MRYDGIIDFEQNLGAIRRGRRTAGLGHFFWGIHFASAHLESIPNGLPACGFRNLNSRILTCQQFAGRRRGEEGAYQVSSRAVLQARRSIYYFELPAPKAGASVRMFTGQSSE